METIIERDVHHDGDNGSAMTAIVAIVAILFIIGVALYLLKLYPFNAQTPTSITPPTVNVNLNDTQPPSNPL
jgi:hypothetical protein